MQQSEHRLQQKLLITNLPPAKRIILGPPGCSATKLVKSYTFPLIAVQKEPSPSTPACFCSSARLIVPFLETIAGPAHPNNGKKKEVTHLAMQPASRVLANTT